MNCRSLAVLFFGAGVTFAGEPPPLTQEEMQPILRVLQTHYTGGEVLSRATITGLLKDHPDAIQLLTVPDAPPAPAPLLSELLTPRIACVRPAAFRPEDTAALKEALTKLAASGAGTLVLDLRYPAPDTDPAVVMSLAGLFLPKETPLFTLTTPLKTSADPVWTRDLLVLIDRETCNAAEILAAILQSKHRAFILGTRSRGRTAVINALPVRKVEGGNLVLRYAAQRVSFADGGDPFGKGVVPDMPVPGGEGKTGVFAFQAKRGLAAAVFHQPRPRNNEASLVSRTNPELLERIALTNGQPAGYEQQFIDRPLQATVDILVATHALEPAAGK
ncbi:MAG TPA: S41 family peptidase [Verrucomicrobiales bacterium]|jgi:hypothetical protein|nr:S41 family peptidase [Verrucomicrobiales bacterium]